MAKADKESENTAFKNWFNRPAAQKLATQVRKTWPAFDEAKFVRLATRGLTKLELMGRVRQFSDALHACLPPAPQSLEILTACLPPPQTSTEEVTDGVVLWPIGQFIGENGIEHFEESMAAMVEFTQRFSAEFAVRPFATRYPERLFPRLLELTGHPNPHVRRWCSEGVRPRLPWGSRLQALVEDPSPLWPILEALKDDPELYVRRSVANNLNDIAKDHPNLVLDCAERWMQSASPERAAIVKHALRTLIKDGHPRALALIGFAPPHRIEVELSIEPAVIAIGESTTIVAELRNRSRRPQKLMLDYAVHYVRQGGKTGVKVFKGKVLELAAGASVRFQKKHGMKLTTIRALYPGLHRVELQVNGQRLAETAFELK